MTLRRDSDAARRFANSRSQIKRNPDKPLGHGKTRKPMAQVSAAGRAKKSRARARAELRGTPGSWIAALEEASGTKWEGERLPVCPISGEKRRWLLRGHHLIEKHLLKAEGLEHWVWEADLGLLVAGAVHDAHHAGERISRKHIPERAWAAARAIDEELGREWATSRLEHDYPEVPDEQ